MAEPAEVREARAKVREQERAVWNDVERVGKDLRARSGQQQSMTQAESDATGRPKPKEGFGV